MEYVPYILFLLIFVFLWNLFFVYHIRSFRELKSHLHSLTPAGKSELWNEYVSLLSSHSTFYNNLSSEGQRNFIVKCSDFIRDKRFIGMEGLEVTHEMKLKIASTAVQVTYGLNNSAFSHYHTVKIYPESFYSKLHNNYLKGGASTSGVLYFSWKDFELGFADSSDRYNLGLHEMAHALRLQIKHGKDFDLRFASYTDHWVELALPEFERMNEGKTSFLREYGATNIEEFFAVCIEHFFEVPAEFKQQLPDIYNHLCFLLNQDPTRVKDDYKLEPGFVNSVNSDPARMPLPVKLTRAYHYDSWHWSFNFILAGLFFGVPAIFMLYGKVLFSLIHVCMTLAVTTAVLVSFHRFFKQKGIEYFRHLLFFCIAGAGPLMTALFFTSNYFIKSDYTTNLYQVVDARRFLKQNPDGYEAFYLLQLKNGAFDDYEIIRTVPAKLIETGIPSKSRFLSVTTSKGIWGLENFEDKAIIVEGKAKNRD